MNLSAVFIARPVATTLLTLGIALAGILAYIRLPVSPLPQVDYPTISVQATMPGASPDTMAATVAAPLERHLGSIADVTEMTSQSGVGSSRITLQFGLNRDSNGAARDVQAAIVAARADLPASLRSNPSYHIYNPSDAPILIVALTSETLTPGQLYDSAATVLQQKLSQVDGVGNVDVAGSSLPAVRVELQPNALAHYGIGLEDVRAALASANAHSPKGAIEEGDYHYQIYTNDQAQRAADYKGLIVAYRNGSAVHLDDLAAIDDSVEDLRNQGLANGKPAVMLIVRREPGANIVETVARVRAELPQLKASLPEGIDIRVAIDRSLTIRGSLRSTQRTLLIAVCLVIGVVFVFLRNARAAIVPSVTVPLSIVGTFAAMYLLNYSLDNLSLMALTIATGFVVDDAIVVLENISRHMEAGMPRLRATLLGAKEVGFTVLSMSTSLIAVFLPILLMGGIVGRLFQEFAITLSMAILISLALALTTTPMMCAQLLRAHSAGRPGRFLRAAERVFDAMTGFYERTLAWALLHARLVIAVLFATIALNVWLFIVVPKGFFPQQDTGQVVGTVQADQSISFQLMQRKMTQLEDIVKDDPGVETVLGFTGGQARNAGFVFIQLKPQSERVPMEQMMGRLRRKLAQVAGARLYLAPVQDIRAGGRLSAALYQYTLQANDAQELYTWTPRLTQALQKDAELTDVNSDLQQNGLESRLVIDRASAARLGLAPQAVDQTLYDAFGQRQVSTIYNPLNQYHVVMEVAPQYWQSPSMLSQLRVSTTGGAASGTQLSGFSARNVSSAANTATAAGAASNSASNAAINAIGTTGRTSVSSGAAVSTGKETMVPLSAFSSFVPSQTPLNVNHQGLFVASTVSFNLAPGQSLGHAGTVIARTEREIGMPASIHGTFAGTASVFQASLRNEPILIAAALVAVYIVLGILYESFIHPITILSTLPSAGVGAVLALLLFRTDFNIMALIGVILLIGIVKKNAIMMIDFALQAERAEGLSPDQAIYRACLLRFRPIMMTTSAALLGALPLALDRGEGSEMRTPLGISIVGGLIVSQMLTLYTTPVVYLYLDRFRLFVQGRWAALFRRGRGAVPGSAD
ncbi:MAG: efflux RND transporter permease subunit [SAR324 cluster bacterium]